VEHRFSLPSDFRTSGHSSLPTFDMDTASDSGISYSHSLHAAKSSFGKSDYFNKEEQQFLSTLNQLVNSARDRYYKTPFRPKTFRINFHPKILDTQKT
jgi:hypothetical protein